MGPMNSGGSGHNYDTITRDPDGENYSSISNDVFGHNTNLAAEVYIKPAIKPIKKLVDAFAISERILEFKSNKSFLHLCHLIP